ncbi:FecCD family ABC transporter permease [Neorhizobium alkalisoli]|uniref:Iron complex transport system permease protein n=1 Tax=Neorhizobium alkalisoli TaxID=528178 RepID=A0A561R8S9_9HYPH|nr:iron ABC transporter permease [Neorhizobium alkalisoli]TWF59042.1 iron complex transport system permease protein [Neorhizobium alkalisoli]
MSDLLRNSGYRAVSLAGISFLARPRIVLACLGLAVIVLLVGLASLPAGSFDLPLPDLLHTILRPQEASSEHRYIVWDIRLPRILIAILSGAMLGLSGAAMQSITRNGLADPGLIGVKEGTAVMVLSLIIFLPQSAVLWRPVAGMMGGLLVAVLVVTLARDMSKVRFILIGIGVSWFFSAALAIFMTTANIRDVQTAMVWLAGSLHAATWPLVIVAFVWLIVGGALLYLTARAADVALLGNGTAIGLGVRLQAISFLRFAGPVLLTAASVSCVGSLGFVGLIAPHIGRFLIGGNQTALLTSSALTGAALVLIADTIGRLAFAPLQIPAGIVMSVLGVPFFLLLLWRRRDRL